MPDLQRLTTEYIDAEDRLRISGETADGQIVVLWLTQRLLHRLLPHLTTWLAPTQAGSADARRAELLHGFAQQAAVQALTPQAPVRLENPKTSWLVHTVDLDHLPEMLRLTFKRDAEATAAISFTVDALRQWLGIVYRQCQLAEWDSLNNRGQTTV